MVIETATISYLHLHTQSYCCLSKLKECLTEEIYKQISFDHIEVTILQNQNKNENKILALNK